MVLIASFLVIRETDYHSSFGLEENVRRPAYLSQVLFGWFLGSNHYAVHASIVLAVIFSFSGMLFIHSFFERTSAPEILYISIFAISFSFEIIRLILPLHLIYGFPSFYLLGASRLLLFARYFGIFSLFTASVCAAGLEVQKTRNVIMIMAIAVLLVVIGVPIDTLAWDTSFLMISGFTFLFKMMETTVFFTAVISFFVAAKVRESREYAHVGIGVALALAGRNTLIGTDNWAGPVLGILLLVFGTWYICSKLHRLHLWL
jgi:hypothetical protein